MANKRLLSVQQYEPIVQSHSTHTGVQVQQERIYSFFLTIVKTKTPQKVLLKFKSLFIDSLTADTGNNFLGVYRIFSPEQEQEFYHTIKRCCYILVNNWETARKYKYIQRLISLFEHYQKNKNQVNPETRIYQTWLDNFLSSEDYTTLKLFVAKFETIENQRNWTQRYTAYLLVAESCDENNSSEQREIARRLSRQLKEQFKFDLAMYVAHSQSNTAKTKFDQNHYRNPSLLGDNLLRLIKMIVSKKGTFNYINIAHIFVQQTQEQTLKEFKYNLLRYLLFSLENQPFVQTLQQQLEEKLSNWKIEHDQENITKSLSLRISNKVIDFLTTENRQAPTALFTSVISQGHALTLVIILLKIILISKNSRTHLETQIAYLISYYDQYPAEECKWLIHFIEIFNVTFAIYTENVEYNLVKMKENEETSDLQMNLDDYRVFSQLKFNRE